MAQVTIAQAPVPTWDVETHYPGTLQNGITRGIASGAGWFQATKGWPQIAGGVYGPSTGVCGGGGVAEEFWYWKGMWCGHMGTVGAPLAETTMFPWWFPLWGPAGQADPGLQISPSSVVGIFDYQIACTPLTDIGTGIMFIPYWGTTCDCNFQPQGATPSGGFGIVGDGAGALQFVTWQGLNSGAVLSQTPITNVTDFELWNHYRLIIVTGNALSPATLSLEANGLRVIDRIPFGTATLERPDEGIALAYNFVQHFAARGAAASGYYVRYHHRWGRFLPSGVAVQGE